MGDTADPESPEGQAARDGQGRVGLLQRGDRPLREEAGGRLGAQRGWSAGQSAWRKSGAARSPHPGVGSPGEAGRGAAQQRGPRFRVGGGRRGPHRGQAGRGRAAAPLDTGTKHSLRRGTARERARSQLAPKIPNRPRGPAQVRLWPRPSPAQPVSPRHWLRLGSCVRTEASPSPELCRALSLRRRSSSGPLGEREAEFLVLDARWERSLPPSGFPGLLSASRLWFPRFSELP